MAGGRFHGKRKVLEQIGQCQRIPEELCDLPWGQGRAVSSSDDSSPGDGTPWAGGAAGSTAAGTWLSLSSLGHPQPHCPAGRGVPGLRGKAGLIPRRIPALIPRARSRGSGAGGAQSAPREGLGNLPGSGHLLLLLHLCKALLWIPFLVASLGNRAGGCAGHTAFAQCSGPLEW